MSHIFASFVKQRTITLSETREDFFSPALTSVIICVGVTYKYSSLHASSLAFSFVLVAIFRYEQQQITSAPGAF